MSGLDKVRNVFSEPVIAPTVQSEVLYAQTVSTKNLIVEGSAVLPDDIVDLTNYAYMPSTQLGYRNKIINGGFDVWQRGTSFSSEGYTSDRWLIIANGSSATRTISQQTFASGNKITGYEPKYYMRYNQSVAGNSATYNIIEQRIEDVRTCAGQTVTVSFWAKTDSDRIVTSQVQQNFSTGGSAEVEAINPVNIALTRSWQRFTYTATMPSISGKTIGTDPYVAFRINLPINATFTVDLWGVQFELGTIATPFEQRPIGTELALCQRYYQNSFNPGQVPAHNASGNGIVYHPGVSGGISGNLYTNLKFYPMRTFPTVSIFNGNNASAVPASGVLAGGLNTTASGIRVYTAGGAGFDSTNIGIDYIRTESISLYAQSSSITTLAGLLAFGYALNAEL